MINPLKIYCAFINYTPRSLVYYHCWYWYVA